MGADDRAGAEPPRPRGRPRHESFEARQERLLDEATALFATHGPTASINDLAARMGINKALVYQHVASKQELFATTVRRARDRLTAYVAEVQTASADGDGQPARGRARVRAQFHAFLDFAAAHPSSVALLGRPEAAALLDGSGRGAVSDAVAATVRQTFQERDLPAGVGPDVLASMLVGMAAATIRDGAAQGWDAEAVIDLLTDFTLGGFAALDRGPLERLDGARDG